MVPADERTVLGLGLTSSFPAGLLLGRVVSPASHLLPPDSAFPPARGSDL